MHFTAAFPNKLTMHLGKNNTVIVRRCYHILVGNGDLHSFILSDLKRSPLSL